MSHLGVSHSVHEPPSSQRQISAIKSLDMNFDQGLTRREEARATPPPLTSENKLPQATSARQEDELSKTTSTARGQTDRNDILRTLQAPRSLFNADGGLSLLHGCVVINHNDYIGWWNGFQWEDHKFTSSWIPSRVAHDADGFLWSLDKNGKLGRSSASGWRSIGHVGGLDLLDIAFSKSNCLWGLNRVREIGMWNGYIWMHNEIARFKKCTTITFDRFDNLWALNASNELARWDSIARSWDVKVVPAGFRPSTITFDVFNRLWAANTDGELAQVSGSQWIKLGCFSGWKIKDLSFPWSAK